jgi:hypothetical protein
VAAGTLRILEFEGALTLTHNATSLILPGGANITTAAGDTALIVSEGAGNWRCVNYQTGRGLHGMDFLTSQNASNSATLDFVLTSYIGGYTSYQFRLLGVTPVTDAVNLIMRTSTNAGSSYDSGVSDYAYALHRTNSNATEAATGSVGATSMLIAEVVGNQSAEAVSGIVNLLSPTSSVGFARNTWDLIFATDAGLLRHSIGGGQRLASTDIDAVRFLFSSGNISSGVIQMFGIR